VLITGACLGFLGALVAVRERGIPTWAVIGSSIVAIAIASVGPPLFSHDVYSYALYGRMWVLEHANPYIQSPSVAVHDPFLHVASNGFRSVYGPLFTLISGLVVWIFRTPAATVAAFKILSGAAWLGVLALAYRLGRRQGPIQAAFAAAVVGLNPVVTLRLIAGGHNDSLVALAIMAALTAWYDGHRVLVTVFLTLGMLVKIVAVIPLVIFLWWMLRSENTLRDRMVTLGKHLAVVVGLTALAVIPFGAPLRVLSAFSKVTSLSNGSPRPPELLLSSASAHVLRSLGLSQAVHLSNAVFLIFFLGLAALALVILLRRSDRPIGEVILLSLLIFMLCSRYLQPWYLAWVVPVACFATRRRVLGIVLAVSLIAAETAPAKSEGQLLTWLARFTYDVYPLLALVFIAILILEVVRRPRTDGQPLEGDMGGVSFVPRADPDGLKSTDA
jgi:Glycosyltransferase family 87